MLIEIDFNSDQAIYMQLRDQIIMGIASSRFQEGDMLPSVRQLADTIGVNMHTVNKAYTVLKQEGYVKVDRRKGVMVAVDIDRMQALEEIREDLLVTLAKASCKNISGEEVHALIDEIYEEYGKGMRD
ncbi:MAG: GntR family transcriptional regulator [Lachnospiraceae bacterium]|nr:GntR family transcriptional regulator [Lachnospiraceae bacterium]